MTVAALDLGAFLDEQVYPALFERLDIAFPEFGWTKRGTHWVATTWPQNFPVTVNHERPDRLVVYNNRLHGIKLHGYGVVRFLDLVNGGRKPTGLDFVEKVRELCQRVGVPFPERTLSAEEQERARKREARRAVLASTIACLQDVLWSTRGEAARAFLHGRGFTADEIRDLGFGLYLSATEVAQVLRTEGHPSELITTVGVGWPRLEGYIMLPWSDEHGHPLTLYGRWVGTPPSEDIPKTMALPGENTKASPLFFDRARRAGHKDLVLVEGLFDAALAQVRGDTRVVACVAAQLSGAQVETLRRYRIASLTICLDPDGGGDRGTLACVESLDRGGMTPYVAPRLPDGLDPDELILRDGLEGWRAHLARSVHGYRYKAQLVLHAHRAADGWTDQAQDHALLDAVAFAASRRPEQDDELARHFWPAFQEAIPRLDLGAVQSRAAGVRNGHGPRNGTTAEMESSPGGGRGLAPAPSPPWPDPLDAAASCGLAGEFVRQVSPHTEADDAALLVQFLTMYGSVIGRGPHCVAEADRHYTNLFQAMVGATSKGRKGSATGQTKAPFRAIDDAWATDRVQSGLSSGEGLIWAVRDPIEKREPVKEHGRVVDYETVLADPGVDDKRLFVLEPEFASTLRVLGRDGNTLSAVVRQAWDTGTLRTLTKHSPATATNAHISLLAHITRDELRRYLDRTEVGNGFANRLLWVCVRRSKILPDGGQLHREDFGPFIRELADRVTFARALGEKAIGRDEAARALWREVYEGLSEGRPGLLGAVTSRAEAQVTRLSLIYALLDRSTVIRRSHLEAALAVWRYCEASARYIFGDALGDPLADEILVALRSRPDGMTRSEIRDHFGRHRRADDIGRALTTLAEQGRGRSVREPTLGRPVERWYAMVYCAESDRSDRTRGTSEPYRASVAYRAPSDPVEDEAPSPTERAERVVIEL